MTAAADAHRLTLVAAPAGYGKSTILGDWVRNCDLQCAWLSLDRFDTQPARLFHGVVEAIQAVVAQVPLPGNDALMALEPGLAPDRAASYDLLLGALERLTEPIVLVIDDIHLAGQGLANGVVGVLAASAPPALRLILSGRGHPPIQLERLRFGEGLGEFGAAELAFTRDEVTRFATSLGHTPGFDAGQLWHQTGGWPVAVHAGLNTPVQGGDTPGGNSVSLPVQVPLGDYIAEEVLDQLDPSLADFVLRATTCDWLVRRLAVELHGRPDGGMLLEACLRDGLYIEEHERRGGDSTYRWHPLFAAQCRRILERRDPLLAERLHRLAARHYEDTDVSECVAHALQGNAARQAVTALGASWLEFLLCNGAHALEQLCSDLPAPWNEDPEILMVSSVCRALEGDSTAASELAGRALARTSALDGVRRRQFDRCRALFEPFPASGRPDVPPPATHSRAGADEAPECLPTTTSGLFLLAQAEFRFHRMGDQAALLLQSAAGTATQWAAVETGSMAELALAFAVAGDLETADDTATQALERADGLGRSAQDRMAAAWLARGIACYWKDELSSARAHLAKAQRLGGDLLPLGPLCVLYGVLVDCAHGEQTHLAESSASLEAFNDQGLYGVSWSDFHTIARAKIAEAQGDLEGALTIVAPLGAGGRSPQVDMLLAELLRRGGEHGTAAICAQALADRHRNRYLDTSMSLTEALLAQAAGDEAQMHERIEHAVHRAEPQSVLRPFTERRDELAALLIRHAVWGTSHEAFIAARMARHADGPPHLRTRSYWTLTEREREVLAYMRSVMTAAEIAEALYISVNTVKTHERSIYRKLGAAGRRDALKTAAERGIV
ncbi:LuxR C-terminal-related transcriptional regulator [Arthrobacter sp. NicSoilB4]|uniref:LuxR C-terminal-related transcriptional regulator n=1 Tax=Arthrobacter sp. NicSoilB4 TaxID=2830997 RepID=UPI001CC8188B|nr:LuxR C-terminal-related transcriptional regulator [Arthrobacter sp. NicSoilB4]